MAKKNSQKTNHISKIKYSKHKTDPILESKSDPNLNLTPNRTATTNTNTNTVSKSAHDQDEPATQKTSSKIIQESDQILVEELAADLRPTKIINQQGQPNIIKSVGQAFIGKHFSVLIVSILLLVMGLASVLFYLQNQLPVTTAAPDTVSNDQPKSKISQTEIESINKLAITPDFPGLEKFTAILNPGSALPLAQIDLDKRTGFKAGTEAALASDFDDLGQRLALVQSVALYEPNTAQNLNLKDYTQENFQKLECDDVADECAFFYKPSIKTERPIDAYRIYFRRNDFVFYFEFAKNDKHPELDQKWLKKLANDLADKT